MFSRMMRTVNATDSLYLTPQQQRELLDYARSLPRRFAAARAVEANEARLAAAAFDALGQSHGHLGDPAEVGWDTAPADVRLVLRTLAQALLMDDPEFVEAKVLGHLRRALGHLDVPPDALRDLFAGLAAEAQLALPPDAYELLAPHLEALGAAPAEESLEAAR